MAQRIRHLTTDQGIPGSNPGRVDFFFFFFPSYKPLKTSFFFPYAYFFQSICLLNIFNNNNNNPSISFFFYIIAEVTHALLTISACLTFLGNPSRRNPFLHSGCFTFSSIISPMSSSSTSLPASITAFTFCPRADPDATTARSMSPGEIG